MSADGPVIVGTLTLDEPFDYLDRGYPTASWWKSYVIQPGAYPLILRSDGYRSVSATLDAVVVEEYFPSSFAGNPIAGGRQWPSRDHTGEPARVVLSTADYEAATALAQGRGLFRGTVALDEGWTTEPYFTSGGRQYYRLVQRGGA